ncbi:type II toxin-antitoxin system RelE/ParE family toxin [Cyclobacterium plantarum]|uniref:Type II toxin-antitoxin system RelE/ParE family toxin n=1 Tax=Cyclobacterium plantarum TaxID=2716263 RepID=A0ABX0HH55_9BACT|nr:type II toxin-antitoxin system RelE/ParE family toxin [Cyclobacterium plantarum]
MADYSLEKWGEKQTLAYIEELLNCLEKIAINPEIGRDASEFSAHLKSYNYKAHSIFYLRSESKVIVVHIYNIFKAVAGKILISLILNTFTKSCSPCRVRICHHWR